MSGVRRLVVAIAAAALLLCAAGAVLAQPVAKPKPKKPTVEVVFSQDVHVVGAHFKSKERVAVTLAGNDTTWKRAAKATAVGKFDVDIGSISLNACSAYTLKVVGAQGSHVALTHPVEPC